MSIGKINKNISPFLKLILFWKCACEFLDNTFKIISIIIAGDIELQAAMSFNDNSASKRLSSIFSISSKTGGSSSYHAAKKFAVFANFFDCFLLRENCGICCRPPPCSFEICQNGGILKMDGSNDKKYYGRIFAQCCKDFIRRRTFNL